MSNAGDDRAKSRVLLFERAIAFMEASERATSLAALVELAQDRARDIGAGGIARVPLIALGAGQAVGEVLGPGSREFLGLYHARGFAAHDVAVRAALRSTRPRLWSDTRTEAVTAAEREPYETAAAFGAREGYVVPIHHRRGAVHAIITTGGDLDTTPETLSYLHLISIHFNAAADRLQLAALPAEQRSLALTQRQIECLRWVAIGKSDWEIGEILGLSENTVHRHIERAKERLDVRTRAQAVMELIQRGLLEVA